MLLEPNPTNECFGCGGANARGMRLTFEQDDASQRIRGTFSLGSEYQGGAGFLHGGLIALLLDEAMGKLGRFGGVRAVTAELHIEYKRPIRVESEIFVEAYEVERSGRDLYRSAEIRTREGTVLARGRGRFVDVGQAAKPAVIPPESGAAKSRD
jgi:uncharacterized protein (TIGR00369 family)